MVYIVIAAMAGYVLFKFAIFIRNRKNAKSMEELDELLVNLINGQVVEK